MNLSLPSGLAVIVALMSIPACGPATSSYARPFPTTLQQTSTIDVQAQRFETQLRITNTSPRALGAGTVWVNSQWAYPLDGLEIGETVSLPLGRFLNEYSERFRSGGFFASERPDTLMLVQFEPAENPENELIGLVAVGTRDR